MKRTLTFEESIFCQALATTELLHLLSDSNFLESDYYKNLQFPANNDPLKYILKHSGIGNPATFQMFLYALLVMPKKILKNSEFERNCGAYFNAIIIKFIYNFETNYSNEANTDLAHINFYNHIRNSVAHSNCCYKTIEGCDYVIFRDEAPFNKEQYCKITIKTADVGTLLTNLQNKIIEYLNPSLKE